MTDLENEMNIVIGSAGRRLYLLRWFRDAFEQLGIDGQIIITESDASSAAFTAGDQSILMPKYSDPNYRQAMLEMVEELNPTMFISVNDWELAMLGNGLGNDLRDRGVVVPGIADRNIQMVTDKERLATFLSEAGVPTPSTVLASDKSGLKEIRTSYSKLVVKHRSGSGSSGLNVIESSLLNAAIERSVSELEDPRTTNPLDQIVVQPYIPGDEYGVDIVGTFASPEKRDYKTLARKKMRMRAGETDKAASVEASKFFELASRLGTLLEPTGLIDVDVLCEEDGTLNVIDVNPRFGGGYPFVHLAGANVPLFYVASMCGRTIDDAWTRYRPGVVSAKFEEVRVSGNL